MEWWAVAVFRVGVYGPAIFHIVSISGVGRGFWACTVGGVVVVESALVSVLAPSFCPELGLGQGGSVVGLTLPTGCRMGSVVVVVPVLVVIELVSSVVLSVTSSVMVCARSGCQSSSATGLVQPMECHFGCGLAVVVALAVLLELEPLVMALEVLLMSAPGCPCCCRLLVVEHLLLPPSPPSLCPPVALGQSASGNSRGPRLGASRQTTASASSFFSACVFWLG